MGSPVLARFGAPGVPIEAYYQLSRQARAAKVKRGKTLVRRAAVRHRPAETPMVMIETSGEEVLCSSFA